MDPSFTFGNCSQWRPRGHGLGRLGLLALLALLPSPAAIALAAEEKTPTAATAPRGQVRVETIAGAREVSLEDLRYHGAARSLSLGNGAVPLGEIILIEFGRERTPPEELLLLFHSGEELAVRARDGSESAIVFDCPFVRKGDLDSRPLSVEIDRVRALALPSHFSSASGFLRFRNTLPGTTRAPIPLLEAPAIRRAGDDAPAAAATAEEEEDRVLLRPVEGSDASRLEGILSRVDSRGIEFEAESLGKLHLPFEKIRAVSLAVLDEAVATDAADSVRVAVSYRDGSILIGELLGLEEGRLRLRSLALGEVSSPLERVVSLEVRGGRGVYLSDLEPERAVHRPDLFTPRPVQRDANVLGGPLSIRGDRYRRGLGMLSHARLDYRLDGNFQRFDAVIGMDDAARPTTVEAERNDGGIALFRIHLDDRVVFEKELSHRDAPVPVSIPTGDATVLGIEVDYGRGFLILDYADWAGARLIRK